MYDVIQLTAADTNFMEQSSIDATLYTEAVFKDGKAKLDNILNIFSKIKAKLEDEIKAQDTEANTKNGKKFDPNKFWKDQLFKDLEDELSKVFGFRIVDVQPYQEKWSSTDKTFESKELNAFVYRTNRYPCEGLVTDKGFYDKSHSLYCEMGISLGLIKALEAREIVAVMLHELGHTIDPALVDIKYMEANVLSKYLTDRKGSINKAEQKFMDENKGIGKLKFLKTRLVSTVKYSLFEIFMNSDKLSKKNLNKLKTALETDKAKFRRQEFTEAYADNFARMYGYGSALMSALKKIDKHYDDLYSSRIKKEKIRQSLIISITIDALKDVHKTDIHRLYALENEYKADINDPSTPAPVKKQLQEDLDELMKIYGEYTNNFSDFQSKVNKLIYDELKSLDGEKSDDVKTESVENAPIFIDTRLDLSFMEAATRKVKKSNRSDAEIKSLRSNSLLEKISKNNSLTKDEPVSKEDEARIRKAMKKLYDDTKVKSIRLIPGKSYEKDDDRSKRTDTKIGGIPYWPKNMKWPTGAKGTPMICIGQLNFDKLPKLEGYPSTGLLQFFIVSDAMWNDTANTKVVYHKTYNEKDLLDMPPRSTTYLNPDKYPVDEDFEIEGVYYPTAKTVEQGINIYTNEYSIDGSFSDVWNMDEKYIKEEFGDNVSKSIIRKACSVYFELNKDYAGTRIGGWPYFTQSDPRDKNHDILLFQIDSESGIMWGDVGIANFFISKDKLASLNFDDVMFTWDCY